MGENLAGKARNTVGVLVVLALVVGMGVWYVVLRDTSSPTANLDALPPTENRSVPAGGEIDGAWKIAAGPNRINQRQTSSPLALPWPSRGVLLAYPEV
jgi:hypothetical protein